ncbi:MAG: SGNH/GDSL hydrolase family protein [Deltaproteobacteria bacterium]|nr:MAG: SGNH/GDSL hydrolase family protein [Deltaproteobacteria bacterium]
MRRLLPNLALALGSLLVVGSCTEVSLRLLGVKPETSSRWRFSWAEKGEIWRLQPGSTWKTVRGGHLVSVNAEGFRDRPFLPVQPGTFRILFLGDSVTFGHGVAEETTFARRLEARLAPRVRVMNAGIPGWSTHQEWLFYRDDGPRFEPDLVLVGFVLNDVTEMQRGFIEIDIERGLQVVRAINWLAQRSASVALIKGLTAGILNPEQREVRRVEHLSAHPDAPHVRRAMERTAEAMLRIAELARERGDGFGVVLFPFHYQVRGEGRGAPQRYLEDVMVERGIPVLNLHPVLAAHRPSTEIFLDVDHLTALGHEVAARAIGDWLERENLLQTRRPIRPQDAGQRARQR